jgi:ubiquinone/menaquinone biosynthesis C-methylase UbiE/uncharacterized protein YbaR (Trm112 family)
MISNAWAEILCCSGCGSPYEVSDEALICERCAIRFPVVDGIPVLIKDTTIGTSLEKIDYDAAHGIGEQTIDSTGREWKKIITQLGLENEDVLEIGAGTGVLTLGLLQHQAVRQLTAIDVSHKFLRMVAARAAADSPVSFVTCDANERHFRSEVFGLVLGRSILHHLLDYDATLRQCHAMLKPGGAAVFFEPVLEGKIILSLLMSLVLRCDKVTKTPLLSGAERELLRKTIRHQTKSLWTPQDRQSLSQREDKYIFEIDRMVETGKEAGFASVEFFNNGDVNPTYWSHLERLFKLRGFSPETIRAYAWIGEEFAATYGLAFPQKLVTPMGYFVFRK